MSLGFTRSQALQAEASALVASFAYKSTDFDTLCPSALFAAPRELMLSNREDALVPAAS